MAPKAQLAVYHSSLVSEEGLVEFSSSASIKAIQLATEDGGFDESIYMVGTSAAMYQQDIRCAGGNSGRTSDSLTDTDASWPWGSHCWGQLSR